MTKAQTAINAEINRLEYAIEIAEEVLTKLEREGAIESQIVFISGMTKDLQRLQG